MASSETKISSQALRNFRHYHFVRHWGKKVAFMIYYYSFLDGQHKTIRDILIDNNVPLTKKFFNAQEVKNLTEKPPEELDITMLNRISQTLWERGVNDPGGDLKGLMKTIKDERNFVSHEEVALSNTDLENKLQGFQTTLQETLDKTKLLFPCHGSEIDQLKAEIQVAALELLRKIREKYDPSVPEDVQNLQEEIEQFGRELSEYILKLSREELLRLYVDLCQILPFDWLAQYDITEPCNIMVSLNVEENMEFHGRRRGNAGIVVDQKQILAIKDPIDPKVVIISGDAGSGKTTILCSIVERWHKNTMDMPELSSFQIVLYMQFRNHSHDNFDDYLKGLLPQTVFLYTFCQVKSTVIGSKCLILCDGYDEANEKSKKFFREILALNFKDVKIVVTTRPMNTQTLTDIVNKGKRSRINLKVLGLQKQDMNLLTERLIGYLVRDDVSQKEALKKELLQKIEEINPKTKVILQTPLYFNLFILLYIECPDIRNEMYTQSSLHLQLKEHMTKRLSNKTGISIESLKKFDALYRKWSLKYYNEEKYEWSETDVINLQKEISCQEVIQNFDAIMSSYFCIKHTKEQLEIKKVFCYRHRSEQEFAVAVNICDDIITREGQQEGNIIEDVLRSKGFQIVQMIADQASVFRRLRNVISFIPGILYSTDRDVLYKRINDIHEFFVSYCISSDTHYYLLVPYIETRLDNKILESLVSVMAVKNLKDYLHFGVADIFSILPPLLSKVRLKRIAFADAPKDLSEVNETLHVASQHGINTEFILQIYLDDYPQFSGLVLHPVDQLRKIDHLL
ncbi:uncharacterized protein LOC135213188 isoform X2 [Macrobrachium nipponense]|uniref:uncharacterized protein LOC135213188 isoform X2 n=1 Tax=Macrobrachium nipponense TaxID=159736 RepID=UPI0030C80AB6